MCVVYGALTQDKFIDKFGNKRESNSVKANKIEILQWLKKTREISQLENFSEAELLVPREITDSLFRQLEVSEYDEDIPDEIMGRNPFENDPL